MQSNDDEERRTVRTEEPSAAMVDERRTVELAGDGSASPQGDPAPRPAPAPSAPLLGRGTALERYVVLEPLGVGGMGMVYAAYDAVLDRKVALKLLPPEDGADGEVTSGRARLLREAQAMARLSHPNVVAIYDVDQHGAQVFMAMELVDGQTLLQWRQQEPRGWKDTLAAFLAAGRGLAAAHAAGLVHRDFKPTNVLVGRDGRVRVTDFGLARPCTPAAEAPGRASARLTLAGCVVGTPRYLAPELLHGGPADTRSDVFSFCLSLYEALCEQPVFVGGSDLERTRSRLQGRIAPPPAHLPAWVMRPVLQGLSPHPHERPASMAALLEVLSKNPDGGRRERRNRLLGATVVLGLLALAAGGWLRHRAPEPECAPPPRSLRSWLGMGGPSAPGPACERPSP